MPKKIKLGDHVKDSYTGFEGTAIGKSKWLYGCTRILIEPTKLLEDGKVADSVWFDEQRVVLVRQQERKISEQSKATTGGPQNDPVR